MSDLDERIRGALGGLRSAPTPSVPKIRPARSEPRTAPPALLAAAALLLLLAGALLFVPARTASPDAVLAGRITSLEARIAEVEHDELRSLLNRELALLRKELEISQVKAD